VARIQVGGAGPDPAAERRKRRLEALLRRERELWAEGRLRVAGVDEAGVGPLAGPVAAAAVVFPPGVGIPGVDDSKKLSPARRSALAEAIRSAAVCWAVAFVEPDEIDRLNVYQASIEAMRRALEALAEPPDHVLVDGRSLRGLSCTCETVIRGDATCHAIAAASILAKTARDARMAEADAAWPGYGFAEHKGYPTEAHRAAIRRLGPSPIHRRSFALLPGPTLWD
jgi:ribonuclease HII